MVNVGVTAAIKDAERLEAVLLLLNLRASLQEQTTLQSRAPMRKESEATSSTSTS